MLSVAKAEDRRPNAVSFKRILFATDFSAASQRVLPWALAIARHYDSELYLVHAIPPEVREMVSMDPLPKELDRGWVKAEPQMKTLADEVRAQHKASHTLLKQGPASVVISSVIESEKIDLLILGTHGRGGVKKLALGSVAEELIRMAPCPVLTIGKSIETHVPAAVDFRSILFATDFGPASTKTLPYALFLAEESKARLVLLNMTPPMPVASMDPTGFGPATYTTGQLKEWESTHREESLQKLRQLLPPETKRAFETEYVAASDFLPEGILTVAEERKVDLITMGANRTQSVRTAAHIPWTVLHHIIAEAKCPVLTVRA